jgi:rubrerythrin
VSIRDRVAAVWAFRAAVERDAEDRFARLAREIAAFDADSPVVEMMERAARDEHRHAAFCAELASEYGAGLEARSSVARRIAPASFEPREAVLYEVVAACCVTETESVASVASLLDEELEPRVRDVVREIARDEVVHSQMGWAHLARESGARSPSFLSPFVPAMLAGAVDERIFSGAEDCDAKDLVRHGVLPSARKREIFVHTLEEVVFPGLARFGIDAAPARAWLAQRTAPLPATEPMRSA